MERTANNPLSPKANQVMDAIYERLANKDLTALHFMLSCKELSTEELKYMKEELEGLVQIRGSYKALISRCMTTIQKYIESNESVERFVATGQAGLDAAFEEVKNAMIDDVIAVLREGGNKLLSTITPKGNEH